MKKKKWTVLVGAGCLTALVLLLLAVVAGLVIAKRVLKPEKIRVMAEQRLSTALGQPVHIASMKMSLLPLPSVRAAGIMIGKPGGTSAVPLSLEELVVHPRIMPLLGGKLAISSVDLVGLKTRLRRDRSGKWILPIVPPPSGASESSGGSVQIDALRIKDGALEVTDETLRSPSGRVQTFNIHGLDGGWTTRLGTLKADLTGVTGRGGRLTLAFEKSDGHVKASAELKGLEAATLAPMLWHYARLAPSGGTVTITGKAEGGGLDDLTADLDAKLSGVTSPGFGVASASFKPVPVDADITATLVRKNGALTISDLKAALPHTAIEGSGRIGDSGASLDLSTAAMDTRDLPAVMGLLGMAPIPGLSVEGATPLRVKLTVPSGPRPLSASGTASIERLRLATLTLKQVKAPFRLQAGVLTVNPLTFDSYKGKETGSVRLNLNHTPASYQVDTAMTGLDVNAALSANTAVKNTLYGTGSADGKVTGAGFDPGDLKRSLEGTAKVDIRDGVIKNFPLLAAINRVLRVTGGEGRDTKFDRLKGTFAIGKGKARTEDLKLRAGDLTVVAKGAIRFDLTLNLEALAVFSPEKSKAFTHSVGELRGLTNAQGELQIPLTIKGPVSAPVITPDLSGMVRKKLENKLKDQLKKGVLKDLFGN